MFERGKQDGAGDGVASLIDEHMRITGSVVSSGDIILAGGVEGEIKCRSLLIEDNASLTGNITADEAIIAGNVCLLYTSPSPRDRTRSRMPSSA